MRRLSLAGVVGLAPVLVLAGTPAPSAPKAPATAPAATPGGAAEAEGAPVYAYLTRDGGTFKAPLFAAESENLPVALVDDEAISLRELNRALAGAHGASGSKQAGKKDFGPLLARLIDARLIVREARQMGIAELPEHREAVEALRQSTGREILQARVLKDVQPDPAEVERSYRQAVRQWKVRSVLVTRQDDAKQAAAQLKAGKKYDDVAKKLVADKKAKGGAGDGQFVSRTNGLPEVVAALDKLKSGEVSAPLRVKDGYALMKVDEIAYPDDAKARDEAVQASLAQQRKAALKKYYAGLVKKYARTDEALLKGLDFEAAKPGLAALEKDQRVIAQIEGAKPITVSELAGALKQGFYHGVDSAIREKRVNRAKLDAFDGLLSARIVPLEVKRQGIEGSQEFKERMADSENGMLFSRFIEKAVLPELKIGDDKLRAYYGEHKKEYAYPTFYKVESIAFGKLKDAEAAVKQLRGGTDFKWLNANAEGQVKAGERKLGLEGTLAATALPAELATLLGGSKKGDFRLHADDASKQYYAIHVIDVVGATEQPFADVKEQIGQKVFEESMTAAIKSWADKLRKASQVRILLTRIGS